MVHRHSTSGIRRRPEKRDWWLARQLFSPPSVPRSVKKPTAPENPCDSVFGGVWRDPARIGKKVCGIAMGMTSAPRSPTTYDGAPCAVSGPVDLVNRSAAARAASDSESGQFAHITSPRLTVDTRRMSGGEGRREIVWCENGVSGVGDTRERDSILAGRGCEIELSCGFGGVRPQDRTRSGDDNARFQASWNRAFICVCHTRPRPEPGQHSRGNQAMSIIRSIALSDIGRRLPGNHVVEEARVWPGGCSIETSTCATWFTGTNTAARVLCQGHLPRHRDCEPAAARDIYP